MKGKFETFRFQKSLSMRSLRTSSRVPGIGDKKVFGLDQKKNKDFFIVFVNFLDHKVYKTIHYFLVHNKSDLFKG